MEYLYMQPDTASPFNTTVNTTDAPEQQSYWILPVSVNIVLYTLQAVTFLFGTTGNALIIYWIGVQQKKLKRCDCLIVSLAMTDFAASIITPLYMAQQIAWGAVWHLGRAGCKIIIGMILIPIMASAWTLVAIAVERWRAINMPLAPNITPKTSVIITLVIYMVSATAVSPRMYFQGLRNNKCYDFYETEAQFLGIRIFYATVSFLLPLIILIISYMCTIYKLYQQKKKFNTSSRRSFNREKRATKMCIIIIIAFFSLTGPQTVYSVLWALLAVRDPVYLIIHFKQIFTLGAITPSILTMNACVNPFVYARMHKVVRKRISNLITRMNDCVVNRRQQCNCCRMEQTSADVTSTHF